MMHGTALPASWTWVRLSELVDCITSGSRDWSKYYAGAGAAFVRTQDINTNRLDLLHVARVALPTRVEGKRTLLRPGDILITITGANVGKCAVVPDNIPEAYVSQSVALVRLRVPRMARYVHASAVTAFRGGRTELERMAYGIGRPVLNLDNIRDLPVPVAPLGEQDRIVLAIESYLTRLDDAAATLERVQHNLTRYRASVLNAAVDGRLVPTEAELARAEGRGYEPASVLLDRILAERRRRWEEAELAKMKAKGKAPKDDEWKAKYVAPVAPDESELPELPDGWCWATVDALSWDGGYGVSRKCQPDGSGPPVLRIPNVQDEILTFDDLKFATGEEGLSPDGVLVPGDFVFVRSNGSKSLIGRGALVVTSLARDYHFASYLIRLRLATSLTTARWFALAWHVPVVRDQILRDAASSAGQHNVRLSAARRYVVPLPPHAEQERLLAEVERLLSIGDSARGLVRPSISRSARVRQSILKWAFEGRLVDQDSSDEPASVLLERIRAERAAATDQPPRRARRENARAPKR